MLAFFRIATFFREDTCVLVGQTRNLLAAGHFNCICNYVTPMLCEEYNRNEHTPQMRAIVEKNGGQ